MMIRYFNFWLGIGWLMILVVWYVSLTPTPPNIEIKFEHLDKVEHLLTYFILMFWFAQLYKTKQSRLFFVLFFILMGVTLEILQGLGQVRFFEYADMLANSVGVLIGWLLTRGQAKDILLNWFSN